MGRAAKKEFVTHKVLIYETLASYMEQDVPATSQANDEEKVDGVKAN